MTIELDLKSRLAHKLLLDHVDRKRWLQRQRKRAHARMRSLGLTSLFSERPDVAIAPDWPDLDFLYHQVQQRRPQLIFEFGSGCSTLLLARALAENAKVGAPGRLISFESEDEWASVTRAGLTGELAEVAEVVFAPAIEAEFDGQPVWRYGNIPQDLTPDMMLLDGPMFVGERKAAVDLLDMESRLAPGFFLVVDGRGRNCRLFDTHMARRWKKRWSRIRKATTYELLA